MTLQRAKEILSSPNMINVAYDGAQIYIENVDDQKGTARIHELNNPNNRQVVAVSHLIEL